MNVGVVGCGNISGIYLENCGKLSNLQVVAVADLDIERAKAKASQFGIPKALGTDELLADPDVEIVLNLTLPKAHAMVSLSALEAGKHVYSEKPLGVTLEEGKQILDWATLKKRTVGCAPDTFLGAGIQTCGKLIREGAIGRPVAATAFMQCHGHESWHPNVAFYYEPGGGPMLDMGPYYLTALVSLLGPIRSVSGMASRPTSERTSVQGQPVPVLTDTHIAGLLGFESGVIGTIVTTFEVWASECPLLEIHGTEGSLSVPDPNMFGGPVRIKGPKDASWREVPLASTYSENWRGIGLSEMADSIRAGQPPRASGELAFHVLEVMEGIHRSSGNRVEIRSKFPQPEPFGF